MTRANSEVLTDNVIYFSNILLEVPVNSFTCKPVRLPLQSRRDTRLDNFLLI